MKILIDTHILIWVLQDSPKLTKGQRSKLTSTSNVIYVSSLSIAEIMIKQSSGKLSIDVDINDTIHRSGFEEMPFRFDDAQLLKELPYYHRDPFDRMLICQAMANKMKIMTIDDKFKRYDCRLI